MIKDVNEDGLTQAAGVGYYVVLVGNKTTQ